MPLSFIHFSYLIFVAFNSIESYNNVTTSDYSGWFFYAFVILCRGFFVGNSELKRRIVFSPLSVTRIDSIMFSRETGRPVSIPLEGRR